MNAKMSMNILTKGERTMIPFTIRYDDDLHYKLKVIASYHKQSLNAFMLDCFNGIVSDWESEHGKIKFPEKE